MTMEGSAVITPNQMFDEIRAIRDEVKHLSSVVDPAMSGVREDITELRKDLALGTAECLSDTKQMDSRVRALENWRWFVLGIAAVFGPFAGFALTRVLGG